MTIDKAIAEMQQQKLDYVEFWEDSNNEHAKAIDMAIASLAAWDRVIKRIKILENDCILGFCDFENSNEIECKKCKLNIFWSARRIVQEELALVQSEVADGDNS